LLALHPRVVDVIWEAVGPLIPGHRPKPHPLGCHRHRIPDRVCFERILRRLVTGSWDVAGRISGAGETTLRRRRDEWTPAGGFEALRDSAVALGDTAPYDGFDWVGTGARGDNADAGRRYRTLSSAEYRTSAASVAHPELGIEGPPHRVTAAFNALARTI
jgi:hypothetical protein